MNEKIKNEKLNEERTKVLREEVLSWINRSKEVKEKKDELPKESFSFINFFKKYFLFRKKKDFFKTFPEVFPKVSEIKVKKKILPRKKIFFMILLFFLGIILVLTVFGIGLYKFQWNDSLTNRLIKIIPYPAVVVNYRILRYSSYIEDSKTLSNFYQKQNELSSGFLSLPGEDEIKRNILERMIKNELAKQLLKKNQLQVKESEIDAEFVNVINQTGSLEKVKQILNEMYGWNEKQFKEKVLFPFLVQQKLEKKVNKDIDQYLSEELKKAKIWRFL